MANEQRGEREIILCGETLTLAPEFHGLVEAEQKAGCSLTAMVMKLHRQEISMKEIAAVIYGGLIGAGNLKHSFADVGKMVQRHGVIKLIAPVGDFLVQAVKGDEDTSGNGETA